MITNRNRNRAIAATVAAFALSLSLSGCSLIGSSPEPTPEASPETHVPTAAKKWLEAAEKRREIVGKYNEIIANDELILRQTREGARLRRNGCPAEHVSVSDIGAVFCNAEMPKKTGWIIDTGRTQAEIEREYDEIVEESKRQVERIEKGDRQIGQGYPPRDSGTDYRPLNPNGNAAPLNPDDEYEGGVYDMPNTKRPKGER